MTTFPSVVFRSPSLSSDGPTAEREGDAGRQGHPCRDGRGLTPTQGSTGLDEEDTTAKVEGATSWGRDSSIATQCSSAQHGRRYPVYTDRQDTGNDVQRQLHRHYGIADEVAMGLGLVISGVMSVPGIVLLVMMVGARVGITVGRGGTRMGQQHKRGLSAHPVVYHNVHGGAKKCQKNPTTHNAHHR
jgi:hypothetical protein